MIGHHSLNSPVVLLRFENVAGHIVNANQRHHGAAAVFGISDCIWPGVTTGDRMAAHRKFDRRRDDRCAGGLRKCGVLLQICIPMFAGIVDDIRGGLFLIRHSKAISSAILSSGLSECQNLATVWQRPERSSRNALAIGIRCSYDSSTLERGVIPCGFFEN
jgi:hypothetical protein